MIRQLQGRMTGFSRDICPVASLRVLLKARLLALAKGVWQLSKVDIAAALLGDSTRFRFFTYGGHTVAFFFNWRSRSGA
ncbi:hypothetical protein BjapCC829_06775 [Bradyrhizobium barranii]|uniref:Uncharacterized protein n=1 Tax=Bradyrhizobium barranii TaxID=2992140 RepID=A0ABY3QQN4_9BRAD|nr:hypothetical protein [Bradyrhizobium japonicum]UFW88278.1 hypothetical protein BjapCC829_06775 [Bradyrhizobium japonicum]